MFFSVAQAPYISTADLNDDSKTISQSLKTKNYRPTSGKMEYNPDPNKQATEMLFSQKKISPFHPSLSFNNTGVRKLINKNI